MIEAFEAARADAVVALEEVPPEEVIHYGIATPRASTAGGVRLGRHRREAEHGGVAQQSGRGGPLRF